MKSAIWPVLGILAFSVTLPALALLYFVSENPFEFTDPYCDLPDTLSMWDIVASGCLDVRYILGFIGIYALIIFIPSLIVLSLMRIYSSIQS